MTNDARLRIDVACADITKVKGDAFVVGHYIGVLPQNAEWALDCALSKSREDSALVLTDLTRRGAVRGSLGDVMFFPWDGRGQVVLAGMGRLGTFKEAQLKTLARCVAQTVGCLLTRPTICTVLIGSGYGNLKVHEAVSGLLHGMGEALAADPRLEIGTLRIVELRMDKAYEILETVTRMVERVEKAHEIKIEVAQEVIEDEALGGVIPIPFGFSLMLAYLAQACHDGSPQLQPSLNALVQVLPRSLHGGVKAALQKLGEQRNARRLGLAFRLGHEDAADNSELADRFSFTHDGTTLRSAAITNMTTVAARDLDVRLGWVDRIVEELQAPLPEVADERALKAFRHLVHPELRERLRENDRALVLELDRNMARIPWEMVHDGSPGVPPLGLHRPLARQLRTAYSPRPVEAFARRSLKALVIGDPDDSLEYARREALAVASILKHHGIEVSLHLGSPDELGLGRYKDVEPADLYDVVGLLHSGDFDLVHYSGHALFFPEYPDRSGWQFKGELLTPSKLEGIDRPPRLIVANACVSARLSGAPGSNAGRPVDTEVDVAAEAGSALAARLPRPPGDSRLVASLADEFFRRGVADYIGTAWEVPEGPAKLFAEKFYEELLRDWQKDARTRAVSGASTLGAAVQAARRALYDQREAWGELGTVWAAYQHYGDPTRRVLD